MVQGINILWNFNGTLMFIEWCISDQLVIYNYNMYIYIYSHNLLDITGMNEMMDED